MTDQHIRQFGNLQPETTEKRQRNERSDKWTHQCDGCQQYFWSDEAANLHYIGDCLIRLSNVMGKGVEAYLNGRERK